ncbi:T9SS type A sorting domain-containing protein [Lewinella cohaerens]|uniref:T9SS type A sorting domain-containing protein n=1 Tax=Lewinella cohaerens TaxID=70995 RepID=UPI00035CE69F|nr:T9SS type A sorting domain-containing protein [Lewinella cohaerens]
MRLLMIIFVSFFFINCACAQYAYQLFRPGVQYLYGHDLPVTDYTSPLLGIRLGGAACQVMYESLQPDIPSGDSSCLTKVPAFIGSEICQSVGQTSLNLGSDEEPSWLQLFPGSLLGSSWLATVDGNDSIYAKVDNLEWASVLGLMDSVKTIGLYTKEENGQLVPLYEEPPLQISRNYGLVQGVFLHWLGTSTGRIDLVGMSTPQVGLQNPDRQSIFQLQADDELHLLTVNTTLSEDAFYHEYREKINTLTGAGWLSGNTIRYFAFSSDQKVYQSGPAANTDTVFLYAEPDTLFLPWEQLSYLDKQPGELIADANLPDLWQVLTLGSRYFCEQPAKRLGAPFILGNEACAIPLFDALPGDDFFAFYSGPYYQNTTIGGFRFRILNYARFAEQSPCGNPFDFVVGTTSAPSVLPLHIWPNPVQNELNLQSPYANKGQLEIEIWSAHGQLIQSFTAFSKNTQIPVQHLPAGAYYLRYTLPNKQPEIIKFIKQ